LADGLAGELNTEQQEDLQIKLRNVRQLQSMIDDLLEVARFQSGKLTIVLERVSISDAIADTVNTLRGAAGILVDNAIKFTPTHGTVKVQARILEKDQTFLVLEVLDSGCGISPD